MAECSGCKKPLPGPAGGRPPPRKNREAKVLCGSCIRDLHVFGKLTTEGKADEAPVRPGAWKPGAAFQKLKEASLERPFAGRKP